MKRTAWYRSRWLKIALVAVIATLVGVRVGVSIWSKSRVQEFVRASQPAWDAERARLGALGNPILGDGAPGASESDSAEACAPAYAAVGVDLGAQSQRIGMALRGSLRDQFPAAARAIVASEKGAIDAFLKATRCGKYTPKPNEAWIAYTRLYPFFVAGRLVVADARIRAEDGDLDAALDRLLAAVKAGTDLGQGTLIAGVFGVSVSAPALETLAFLLGDGRLSPAQRDRVERALSALAPRMPTPEDGVEKQRLTLHQIAVEALATGEAPPNARPSRDEPGRLVAPLLPALTLLADALWRQERYFVSIKRFAAESRDPILFVSLMANAEPRAASRRLTGFDFPPYGLTQKSHNLCVPRAWTRMLLAALAIEKAGSVPATLPAMDDPCGAGAIVYIPGPDGRYSLASVGKDGALTADDLRLERGAAAPKPTL